MRSFIDQDLGHTTYCLLILFHLIYCNFIFDDCAQKAKGKLQTSQNAALRVVKNISYIL